RRRRATFTLQPLPARARSFRRGGPTRTGGVLRRLPARALRARRGKPHAGAAGLGQADRDRLLRRARAVLALAHVVYLLAHELARLRRGRLVFRFVAACGPQRLLLRHGRSLPVWLVLL